MPPLERVATEVRGRQGERLDLVGFDESDIGRVLIEVKFWAGLDENQPNTYLGRLLNDGAELLIVGVFSSVRRSGRLKKWLTQCMKSHRGPCVSISRGTVGSGFNLRLQNGY